MAGEASGDTLGAGLIEALRAQVPDAEFVGMAGPKMIAAGCEPWYRAEEIAVMGFFEVLPHLRRILTLRRELIARIERADVDAFIGIDAQDFNRPAAAALKRAGIKTVQYVSPQVWAWRQSRVATIREAVDLVLCVLPFEPKFYEAHGVNAKFVGHPLADMIPLDVDKAEARAKLGLPAGQARARRVARQPPQRGVAPRGAVHGDGGLAEARAARSHGRRRARQRLDGRAVPRGDGRHGSGRRRADSAARRARSWRRPTSC